MTQDTPKTIAIIGGGPAGLMAAERLTGKGMNVQVFEAMPTPGRKLLMAGKSGLNITHSEDLDNFISRYGAAASWIKPQIEAFTPFNIRRWAEALGQETFTGSSGRVFPKRMKASPLLRAWLTRLDDEGVTINTNHKWLGWDAGGALKFETKDGEKLVTADATILALGGGSYPRLGSNGAWQEILADKGVTLSPLKAANVGFLVNWSDSFKERFAGEPVKAVRLSAGVHRIKGEFVISQYGVEGSAIYMLSATLREKLEAGDSVTLTLDLAPDRKEDKLIASLMRPRGKNSISNHLRKVAGIKGVKAALLREGLDKATFEDMTALAGGIKACPVTITGMRPMEEAISTAGGVKIDGLNRDMMLTALEGVFVAGEMVDWEAPTGGYLLTACLAQGAMVGDSVATYLGYEELDADEEAERVEIALENALG